MPLPTRVPQRDINDKFSRPSQVPAASIDEDEEEFALPSLGDFSQSHDEDDDDFDLDNLGFDEEDDDNYEDDDEEELEMPSMSMPTSNRPSKSPTKVKPQPKQIIEYEDDEDDYEEEEEVESSPSISTGRVKDARGQDVFINKKNKTLRPLGQIDGKVKVKVNKLDTRTNLKRNAFIVQIAVLLMFGGIFLFSLYRTFFPPAQLTTNDMIAVINARPGMREALNPFPINRAENFAIEFMRTFLTINNEDPASRNQAAIFFDTGRLAESTDHNNLNARNQHIVGNAISTIKHGPIIWESRVLGPQTARFIIGSLVEFTQINPETNEPVPTPRDGSANQWLFFAVNVFYDPDLNQLAITDDSPSIARIPTSISEIPQRRISRAANPQTGEPAFIEVTESIQTHNPHINTIVHNFITAFRVSSRSDYSALVGLFDATSFNSDDNIELIKEGLNGQFDFAHNDPAQAITIHSYWARSSSDFGTVQAYVSVLWQYTISQGNAIQFRSQYLMTMRQQEGGFLIQSFNPVFYNLQ